MSFKKFISIFLLYLTPSYAIYSMQALSSACRFGAAVISFGAPSTDALFIYNRSSFERDKENKYQDLDQTTKSYLQDYLKQLGVNTANLIIKQSDEDWHVSKDNELIVPLQTMQSLKVALEKNDHNNTILKDVNTALAHEAHHMLNKDNKKRQQLLPALACMSTYTIDKLLKYGLHKIPFLKNGKLLLFALGAGYLATLPTKIILTYKLDSAVQRYHEKKADAFAFSHATDEELQHTIQFYLERHEIVKKAYNNPEQFKNFPPNAAFAQRYSCVKKLYTFSHSSKSFADWLEGYPALLRFVEHKNDQDHPIDLDRMNAAKRALEKRQQQSAQK